MSSAPSPCDRQQVLGMPVDVCPDVLAAAVELHRNGGGQLVTADRFTQPGTNFSVGLKLEL